MTAGVLQKSQLDQRDLAEVSHPEYPGERLVLCRNPLLAEERKRKREELLAAEQKLEPIAAATRRQRQPLHDAEQISYRVGRALGARTVAK